jgi:hypothetical protein
MRLQQALLGLTATGEPFALDHQFHALQDELLTLPMMVALGKRE